MKNEQIAREVEELVRYRGENFVEWHDDTMSTAKRLDSQRLRSHELATRVLDAELFVEVDRRTLVRGDLIVRRYADGVNAIEQVISIEENRGWIYTVTTATGGRFRTVSWMGGPEGGTERKIVTEPTFEQEVAELEAELAERDVVVVSSDDPELDEAFARALAATDETGLSDGTDRPAATVEELDEIVGFVESSIPDGIFSDEVELDESPTISVGDRVRFVQSYSTGVLMDGGPTAGFGYETEALEVGDDGRGVLVRFPAVVGMVPEFRPCQIVPSSVLEVVRDEPEICSHVGTSRETRSFHSIGAGIVHELVCGECGEAIRELLLLDRDRLVPGDVVILNTDEDASGPYWQIERIAELDDDGTERRFYFTRDHADGLVERNVVDAPSCLIVGVFAEVHRTQRERTVERNRKILGNLAVALLRGRYVDGSGEWEDDALVRDFRSAGGFGLTYDSILDGIEGRFDRIQREIVVRAREIVAERVHEAIREAAPAVYSPTWADALVRSVEAVLDGFRPNGRDLSQARDEVLGSLS